MTDNFFKPWHERRYHRPGDYADAYDSRMVGYWATRQRLASQKGTKWERKSNLYKIGDWRVTNTLGRMLPPECVAPANLKMRSPRPDVTLADIIMAIGHLVGTIQEVDLRDLVNSMLDQPAEFIKTMATINGLRQVIR